MKELETKIPENVRRKPANPRPRHSAYIKRNVYDAYWWNDRPRRYIPL